MAFGTPARTEICRPGFGPFPACRALPKIVSFTSAGSMPARFRAALAATTPMSGDDRLDSLPPNFPIGVRTPETIKTSCKACDLQNVSLAGKKVVPQEWGIPYLLCHSQEKHNILCKSAVTPKQQV